jgi:hypothetical protein
MASDSFFRVQMDDDNQWTVQFGLHADGEMVVHQAQGTNLSNMIHYMNNKMQVMAEISTSNPDLIPRLQKIDIDHILVKSEKLKPRWSMAFFGFMMDDNPVWFAVAGYDKQFDEGSFANGVGNTDLTVAIGECDVYNTCRAVHWNREMLHGVHKRVDGKIVRANIKRRNKNEERRKKVIADWYSWAGHAKWDKALRETPHGTLHKSVK